MYRIAGLYAPANGEFNTPNFTVPSGTPLWINAAATWKGKEITGGCDEGCGAYIFVAILDALTDNEIEGYGVNNAVPLLNVDGLRLLIQWKKRASENQATGKSVFKSSDTSYVNSTALAGRNVKLRIYFRDATIYAVGA